MIHCSGRCIRLIEVIVEKIEEIEVDVDNPGEIDVSIEGELISVGDYKHYDGDYSVKPKFEEQILKTKNKVMDFDVDVKPIPVEKVSNPSGGNTIIIGG